MARRPTQEQRLTELELEIMKVLWDSGAAGVSAVQELLSSRDLAYTTVQTMLNVLVRKGRAKRTLKDRAYIYRPVLTRDKAMKAALRDMVERFFGGSADRLVMNLVETRQPTPKKLEEIQRLFEKGDDRAK
jgi:BlaI family transcriptional regulator, penicillinase repressor